MARIRSIKPAFFKHYRLFVAERETGLPLRLAFAGLWTVADREGRFRWEPEEIKVDCLPYDDVDFARVLDALWTRGHVVKYEVDGRVYGVIPSWKDHQIINNRELASKLPEPNENNTLTRETRVHDASGTPRKAILGEGKGREGKGTDLPTRQDASPGDNEWETFKAKYPSRGAASNPWKPARESFDRHVKAGVSPAELILAAEVYGKRCDETKIRGTDKVAQAVTWLRQERFRDYFDGMEAELARRKQAEEDMAARGYVWTGEKWEKRNAA